MLKIGLTGGIGSGKSYVAAKFEKLGIPIYFADKEAKKLMNSNNVLKLEIKQLLGQESYHRNGRLNRAFVATKIFSESGFLAKINKLVHPAVKQDFYNWAEEQKSLYVIEESAIIYEHGMQTIFDKTILVVANKSLRLKRLKKRDGSTDEQIKSRMKKQWTDAKKTKLADFIVENNEIDSLEDKVNTIHQAILNLKKVKK